MKAKKVSRRQPMLWGFPVEIWDIWGVRLLWAGGAFGALALITSLGSSFILYHVADIAQRDLEEQSERLAAESDASKAAIAEAQRETAKAQERIAALQNEAKELAIELEREKRARLPRAITDDQAAVLAEELKKAPRGRVYVVPDWMNPEAKIFGANIERQLSAIGYDVQPLKGPDVPLSYAKLGMFLVVRDASEQPPHLAPLYKAFRKIGFECDVHAEKYVPDTDSVFIGISAK